MRRAARLALLTLAVAVVAPRPASAAPAPRCKVDNVATLAFGNYSPFSGAPTDAIGSIGYDCLTTPGPIITISTGSSGSYAARTLRLGGAALQYNVFTDASRTQVLGDGSGGSAVIDATPLKKQTFPLYGRIFASQVVPRGTYTDTLIVTITF